eukprot:GFKZ01007619.1.p1 GENE.GFKZ01007619.1~~GFKZ01007619.1.p1  ORF type:complete len:1145 (+),score=202.32 GFKZ01007619.1:2024-5458(+)
MEFVSFSWVWILLVFLCAVAFLLLADRRGRSAMQSYSDELHRAARELTLRSNELTSMREAAKESKQESKRRATELKSLRDTIAGLNTQVSLLTEERDQACDTVVKLQAKVTDLTTRLARADVRRASLEKELSAATLMRLEVLSQLRTDETQRIRALNRLRQPGGGVVAAPLSPVATRRVDTRLSPLSVAKSPSESFLSKLQPDLDVDSSEDEVDMKALEDMRVELERRMRRALAGQRSDIFRVSNIELGKAAVSAKGIALNEGTNVAIPAAGICHSTHADDNVSKKQSSPSAVEEVVEVASADDSEVSVPNKQTEDDHSRTVGQISSEVKAEGEQEEHVEISLAKLSKQNSSTVLNGGKGAEAVLDGKASASGVVSDVKTVETESPTFAAVERASCAVTQNTAERRAPSIASEMRVDHHEKREGEQLHTIDATDDEEAILESETVEGDDNLVCTPQTGAEQGDFEKASKEGNELGTGTNGITGSDHSSSQVDSPCGFVAGETSVVTAEFAESSGEKRHEYLAGSVAMATDEFMNSEDKNDDGFVLQVMTDSTVVRAAEADGQSNGGSPTLGTAVAPHPIVALDETEADCSSTSVASDGRSQPMNKVDEPKQDCASTLPMARTLAETHTIENGDEEEDDCSPRTYAGDTYAEFHGIEEEKDCSSSALPEADTHPDRHPIEEVENGDEEQGCSPVIPTEDTYAGCSKLHDIDEEKGNSSSPLPEASTHAGPYGIEAFDNDNDVSSSALPTAETSAELRHIEEEDDCSSAFPVADPFPEHRRIENVEDEEHDCSVKLSLATDSESVRTDEERKDPHVGKVGGEGSMTGDEHVNEFASTRVLTVEPGNAELMHKHENEHLAVIGAGAGTESETVLTAEGVRDGRESKEMRGDEGAHMKRNIGGQGEADMSSQKRPAELAAETLAHGCSMPPAEREERQSPQVLGAGRDEDASLVFGEKMTESGGVCDESPVSVKGAGSKAEPAECSFGHGFDHNLRSTTEALDEIASAVNEAMEEIMSTAALQTSRNSAIEVDGEYGRPESDRLMVNLDGFNSCEVQESGAGSAEANGVDKDTGLFRRADSSKLEDEALVGSMREPEAVSISRTPWLESLHPKLQKGATLGTIFAGVRPVSPDVPGVISSAIVRKTNE